MIAAGSFVSFVGLAYYLLRFVGLSYSLILMICYCLRNVGLVLNVCDDTFVCLCV